MFFFNSTLEGGDTEYELRTNDSDGFYISIEDYIKHIDALFDYDCLGELATEYHVTNIPVDPNTIQPAMYHFSYIEPTHVRLPPEYANIFSKEIKLCSKQK